MLKLPLAKIQNENLIKFKIKGRKRCTITCWTWNNETYKKKMGEKIESIVQIDKNDNGQQTSNQCTVIFAIRKTQRHKKKCYHSFLFECFFFFQRSHSTVPFFYVFGIEKWKKHMEKWEKKGKKMLILLFQGIIYSMNSWTKRSLFTLRRLKLWAQSIRVNHQKTK